MDNAVVGGVLANLNSGPDRDDRGSSAGARAGNGITKLANERPNSDCQRTNSSSPEPRSMTSVTGSTRSKPPWMTSSATSVPPAPRPSTRRHWNGCWSGRVHSGASGSASRSGLLAGLSQPDDTALVASPDYTSGHGADDHESITSTAGRTRAASPAASGCRGGGDRTPRCGCVHGADRQSGRYHQTDSVSPLR